jgi:hypothetical protein
VVEAERETVSALRREKVHAFSFLFFRRHAFGYPSGMYTIGLGFIGDALADAFGVGSHEEAFAALTHTFGTGDPGEAFAQIAHTFGVHDCGLGDSISGVNFTRIGSGQNVALGRTIASPNGRTLLSMQADGNLVVYDARGRVALWASNTNGKGGAVAIMQSDGNLVVYNQRRQPLWASGTDRHPGAYLAIQDDGNVVIYDPRGHAIWATNTNNFQKNFGGGGGFDLGRAVTSAVHDVGKATGLPADQVLNVAKNAGDTVAKAVTSGANLIAQAGGDAGKFVQDRANAIAKDPLGTLTQIATAGPLAIVGNPDQILKSLGIPTPDDLLRKVGIPPFSFPSPDALAHISNPQELLEHLPGLSQFSKFLPTAPNPQDYTKKIMSAVSSGDPDQIKSAVMSVGHQVADSMSMVPGIGDVISGPLAAAITAIESGSPLRTALELLLSQAPIPPDVKDLVLRPAIHGISDVVEKHENVSDALVDAFKEGIMAELAKQNVPEPARKLIGNLVDAMVQIILKHKPLDQAAAGLAKQGIDTAIGEAQKRFGSIPGLPSISSLLPSGGLPLQLPAGLPKVPGLDTTLAKISSLQDAYQAIKNVGDRSNKIFALTQGIIKLNGQDPSKTNPAVQKQIHDLKTSIEAQKIHLNSNAQKLNTNLGKLPPHHRHRLRVAGNAPAVLTPAPTTSVAPTPAATPPAAAASAPNYPPYPTFRTGGQ